MTTSDNSAPRGPWLVGGEFADHDPRMEVLIAFERDAVPAYTLRRRREAVEAIIRAAPDLLVVCVAMLGEIEDLAEDQGYGHFPGGDPRGFTPDPECSTEEERAAHARDCAAMNAGGQALVPPTAVWERTAHGVSHYHRQAYGLGMYVVRNEYFATIATEARAAIAKAKP